MYIVNVCTQLSSGWGLGDIFIESCPTITLCNYYFKKKDILCLLALPTFVVTFRWVCVQVWLTTLMHFIDSYRNYLIKYSYKSAHSMYIDVFQAIFPKLCEALFTCMYCKLLLPYLWRVSVVLVIFDRLTSGYCFFSPRNSATHIWYCSSAMFIWMMLNCNTRHIP